MSARTELIALLAPYFEHLTAPRWITYDYPANIDAIEAGAVVLMVDTYAEQAQPIRGLRSHLITLALVVPTTDPETAANDLDDAWEWLRAALDDVAGRDLIHWTEASRGKFDDTYPSLTVPVSMNTKDS